MNDTSQNHFELSDESIREVLEKHERSLSYSDKRADTLVEELKLACMQGREVEFDSYSIKDQHHLNILTAAHELTQYMKENPMRRMVKYRTSLLADLFDLSPIEHCRLMKGSYQIFKNNLFDNKHL